MSSKFIGSHYLVEAFEPGAVNKILQSFEYVLKDKVFGDLDGVVCRGTSGLMFAPLIAHTFNLKLMIVRKPNDGSHANGTVEGHADIKRYIIIDDFACSGATIENTVEEIPKAFRYHGQTEDNSMSYVGCYFWTYNRWAPKNSQKEKIASTKYDRYLKYCHGKTFVHRCDKDVRRYHVDTFKGYEDKDMDTVV